MGLFSSIIDLSGANAEDFYSGINPPNVKDMQVLLEQYVQQGLMTPEEAKVYLQDPSAFEQIQSDPQFKEAQMRALSGLEDYASEGGLNAQARGRLHDIQKEEGIRERGAREALTQNANQRGVGGSGLEFLSALKNQQDSAGRQSDRDTQVAADAEMRALDALVKGGDLAGNIRGQDFDEAAKKAAAMDEIKRFNTANQNEMGRYNTGARNDAQKYNLNTGQTIADANVDQRNKQQTYNKDLLQKEFENKMDYAAGRGGASERDRTRQNNSMEGIESGISSIAGGAYGAYNANEVAKAKENKRLKDEETGNRWSY